MLKSIARTDAIGVAICVPLLRAIDLGPIDTPHSTG